MSYYNGAQHQQQPAPPPLPPRSPRPPGAATSPTYGQSHWTYPPPPPGPPPRSPGVQGDQPPPIPPRPPGFEVRNGTPSSRLSPAPQSFLPPPISPNRQAYPNTLPPPPPRPSPGYMPGLGIQNATSSSPSPVQSSPVTTHYGYTSMPSSNPVIASPPILSNIPPPPSQSYQSPAAAMQQQFQEPSTMNFNTSNTSPYVQYVPSEYSTPTVETPQKSPQIYAQGSSSPDSTSQAYSQTPDSPPPAYTPIETPLEGQHVNIPSYSSQTSNVNRLPGPSVLSLQEQSSNFSSNRKPSTCVTDLEGTIQSLSINQLPSAPLPPSQHLPQYTGSGLGSSNHTPYSAPPPSNPPSIPPKVHIDRDQEPPQAVQACIDTSVTFTTDWYWHPSAPDFWICSKCYVDHIWPTQFRNAFTHKRLTDSKPRLCRFSKPRMKDLLFKDAITSGHLSPALLDWMRYRPTIPNCHGTDGVKADAGIDWYKARGDDIPHFVSCRACYEDIILANPGLSTCFERSPPQPQGGQNAIWSCDMAVAYIAKEYEGRGKLNNGKGDWIGFTAEAKARLSMQPCPGIKSTSTWRRPFFVPTVPGLEGIVLCAACYCDQVAHASEEPKWRQASELSKETGRQVRCDLGAFNTRVLIGRCHDTEDFAPWWRVVSALQTEKFCDEKGIPAAEGTWYTLKQTNAPPPSGFQICRACYLSVVEPLNLAPFFERKQQQQQHPGSSNGGVLDKSGRGNGNGNGNTVLCCFNIAHPRLGKGFLPRILEAYFTRDARALAAYATEYADIPPCPRDDDDDDDVAGRRRRRRWFGWRDCTICAECWHGFARHHLPLAARVELRGEALEGGKTKTKTKTTMCEMYSPRMRKLYLECNGGSGGNANGNSGGDVAAAAAPLLEYSAHRRTVWRQTVLPIRQILFQSKMKLHQQNFLNVVSSQYYMAGGLQDISTPSHYSYSQAGLGTFANYDYLQSAQYSAQAAGVAAGVGRDTFVVGQLEQKWRAVE